MCLNVALSDQNTWRKNGLIPTSGCKDKPRVDSQWDDISSFSPENGYL